MIIIITIIDLKEVTGTIMEQSVLYRERKALRRTRW